MIVTVELPLPPRDCSPNHRGHTKARARAVAQYRQDAFYCYREAKLGPMSAPIVLHATWYLAKPTTLLDRYNSADLYFPLDDDDAWGSLKAARDALVDAGVVPTDTRNYVRIGSTEWRTTRGEHEGRRCVVLRIESPEGNRWHASE